MAPKLNRRESELEGYEVRRKSRNSGQARRDKSRLEEREVKHLKVTNAKALYDLYTFGGEIGKGTFGTVMAVVDKSDDKSWAIKIISKTIGKKVKYVYNEIHILKMVHHPHIIHLEKVFETQRKIYLVLERCTGELADLLKDRKKLEEIEARKIIGELCSAVAYLHKYDIVHRDLKLENILLARNPKDPSDLIYVKVADFSLSVVKSGATHEDMLQEFCGTLIYMPPEIITRSSYSQQCDVWSIGIIMHLLLVGRFPFYCKEEEKLIKMICSNEINYERLAISSEAADLMSKMLAKNPAVRITAWEVLQHAWTTGKSLLDEGQNSANVLDMMKMWRLEMKVCDWKKD